MGTDTPDEARQGNESRLTRLWLQMPAAMSPEEVARLLEAAPRPKYKAECLTKADRCGRTKLVRHRG